MERVKVSWGADEPFGFVVVSPETTLRALRGVIETQLGVASSDYSFSWDGLRVTKAQEKLITLESENYSVVLLKNTTLVPEELESTQPFMLRAGSVNAPALQRELSSISFHEKVERLLESQELLLNITVFDGVNVITYTELPDLYRVLKKENYLWVDVEGLKFTASVVEKLVALLNAHPVSVEDCLEMSIPRQKIEPFENYFLLVLKSLSHLNFSDFQNPLSMLMFDSTAANPGRLVSFHAYPLLPVELARKRLFRMKNITGLDILHLLVDCVADTDLPEVDRLLEEVKTLEELVYILGGLEQTDLLRRMGFARRKIEKFRQLLWPKRDVLTHLTSKETLPVLPERYITYFKDVIDHVFIMLQRLEIDATTLSSLQSTYLAKVSIEVAEASNNVNLVMKKFSSVATMLLPMTIITGMWGMNVTVPGQSGVEDFSGDELVPFILLAISMLSCLVAMTMAFRHQGWL